MAGSLTLKGIYNLIGSTEVMCGTLHQCTELDPTSANLEESASTHFTTEENCLPTLKKRTTPPEVDIDDFLSIFSLPY